MGSLVYYNYLRFFIAFSLHFLCYLILGRKKHIAKSPSLNIEQNDVTDGSDSYCILGGGGNDEQLLTMIEQQIFNDESKTRKSVINSAKLK